MSQMPEFDTDKIDARMGDSYAYTCMHAYIHTYTYIPLHTLSYIIRMHTYK
jgi:hypothetical protein